MFILCVFVCICMYICKVVIKYIHIRTRVVFACIWMYMYVFACICMYMYVSYSRVVHKVCHYIFKIFSNLWQFFSKCGKVSVSSKAFGFVPFCSISFLLLLVRSVIMTGLPRDCHGSCTDMVEQCTVHIATGPARAQLE